MTWIRGIANLWSLGLFALVVASLLRFAYTVCLKRLLRARRISHHRERRLLREAARR